MVDVTPAPRPARLWNLPLVTRVGAAVLVIGAIAFLAVFWAWAGSAAVHWLRAALR